MIRFKKPVKLLEWGEGTNTTNQIWTEAGEGSFVSRSVKDGVTTLVIQTNSLLKKTNAKDNHVKLVQQSEGMAAQSTHWGEVAMGVVKSTSGNSVTVEVSTATKISDAANWWQRFLNLP